MIPFLVCAVLVSSASLRQGSAPQTTAQTPASLRVDWHTEKKLRLLGNKPVYPRIAMMAQIKGVVRIRMIVATDGSTKELEYLSGPPLLMLAALNAVRTWRFKPPLVNGESAEIETVAEVEFYLNGDEAKSLVAQDRKKLEKRPNDAKAHADLAHGLLTTGRIEESVSEYRKALSLQPDEATCHFGLARALHGEGDLDAAISEYRRGLALRPKDTNARSELASLLEEDRDLDGAVAEYRTALQQEPQPVFHYNLGSLLMRKQDFDGAITEFRHAIHEGWGGAEVHYQLGTSLEKTGDLQQAFKEYKQAASLSPQEQDCREARDRLARSSAH